MADIAISRFAIEVVRGDDWKKYGRKLEDDGSTPEDLAGQSIEAQVRWTGGSQEVAITVTDADGGEFTLSLTETETALIPLGQVSALFVGVTDGADQTTWFRAPVNCVEGVFV